MTERNVTETKIIFCRHKLMNNSIHTTKKKLLKWTHAQKKEKKKVEFFV